MANSDFGAAGDGNFGSITNGTKPVLNAIRSIMKTPSNPSQSGQPNADDIQKKAQQQAQDALGQLPGGGNPNATMEEMKLSMKVESKKADEARSSIETNTTIRKSS